MKKIFLVLAGFSFVMLACGPNSSSLGPQIQAEVLKLSPLPDGQDSSEIPKLRLEKAQFRFLRDLDTLSGDHFTGVSGGELSITNPDSGSLVNISNWEGGKTPLLRYRVISGTAVPNDYESLLMLSSYYQFDQVAQNLEDLTGIAMDSIKQQKGVMKLLFYPRIHIKSSGVVGNVTFKTNAAFDPRLFQFLIMPPSRIEDVPLGANLQVIAHEFGHAIFQFLLGGSSTNPGQDKFMESDAVKGLNEGFADYFSYVMTGSSNILGGSFGWSPEITVQRDFSKIRFTYDSLNRSEHSFLAQAQQAQEEKCTGKFYCHGTLFAKSLLAASKSFGLVENTKDNRTQFMRILVAALQGAKPRIEGLRFNENSKERILGQFFQAFLTELESQNRTLKNHVSTELIKNFGSTGFAQEFR
jgi:hypothetical protein